jgi:hypothetical protein
MGLPGQLSVQNNTPAAEKGSTIGFTIKPELAHYFDIESGLRK